MRTSTVFKGDGIGPEITDAVLKILDAAGAPLEYEIFRVGAAEYEEHGALIPEAVLQFGEIVHGKEHPFWKVRFDGAAGETVGRGAWTVMGIL